MSSHVDDADDDEIPHLSADTLAALNEFYSEQESKETELELLKHGANVNESTNIPEDWQLSQFWYNDETADTLAKEVVRAAGTNGSVACVSCPTVYKRIQQMKPETCSTTLFEFDDRFSIFCDDYVFYDYKAPLQLSADFREKFDVVIADPPFLSEECLTKVSCTIRFLSKDKIVVCTGAVMEELVKKLLALNTCQFVPRHVRSLGNTFSCYANYEFDNYLTKVVSR